ncbi:MAG: hypothetical protein IV108_14100 [Burkholderiales bacterium]|nr:hypothetical protein [Burkholderiales bacterium]
MRAIGTIIAGTLWLLVPVLALGPVAVGEFASFLVEHKYVIATHGNIWEAFLWAPMLLLFTVPAALGVLVIALVVGVITGK